jgi:DNA-binding XRE family transcriptional regulator
MCLSHVEEIHVTFIGSIERNSFNPIWEKLCLYICVCVRKLQNDVYILTNKK